MIIIVLLLRAARGIALRASREHSARVEAANTDADKLYDGVSNIKYAPPGKDIAPQTLELSRFSTLENELRKKEKLLESWDAELKVLRSRVSVLTNRQSEMVSAKARAESMLRAELKNTTDILQSRSTELEELRSKLKTLTEQSTDFRLGKERAENILQQELKKNAKILQAKQSTIAELENSLSKNQELWQSRSTELEALKSQVNTLTERLTDFRLGKERARVSCNKSLTKKQRFCRRKMLPL
jgi:chromosome segregation ATPase